jgi:hypothetical protein
VFYHGEKIKTFFFMSFATGFAKGSPPSQFRVNIIKGVFGFQYSLLFWQ